MSFQIFKGNSDQNTIVSHTLSPVIRVQFIRIRPLDCHGACALRAEFVGCYEGKIIYSNKYSSNNQQADHFL